MNSGDFNREILFEILRRGGTGVRGHSGFRRQGLEQANLGFAPHVLQLPAAQPLQSGAL
jgi:hypothetical protein